MKDTLPAKPFTQIAEGTEIHAHIKTEQNIRVAGFIDGEIESDHKIIITPTGRLKGNFIALNMEISGIVEGTIRTKEKLVINSSANIKGHIFAKHLVVNEGAQIHADINSGLETDVLNAQSNAQKKAPPEPKKSEEIVKAAEDKEPPKLQTPPPSRFVEHVLIGIPGSDSDTEVQDNIKAACENFMESLGYELEIFDDPDYNPFYQNLTYVKKSHDKAKDIDQLFENGKSALEESFMKKEQSAQSEELYTAAKALTKAIGEIEEIVIVLGKIILVQVIDDNVQTVAAEMVSHDLSKKLKEDSRLVIKPGEIYSMLQVK